MSKHKRMAIDTTITFNELVRWEDTPLNGSNIGKISDKDQAGLCFLCADPIKRTSPHWTVFLDAVPIGAIYDHRLTVEGQNAPLDNNASFYALQRCGLTMRRKPDPSQRISRSILSTVIIGRAITTGDRHISRRSGHCNG